MPLKLFLAPPPGRGRTEPRLPQKTPLGRGWVRRAANLTGAAAIVLFHLTGTAAAATEKSGALKIMRSKGCGACHVIPGIAEAMGTVGPSLKGLKERTRIAGGRLENSPENLRDWLKDPKNIKSDTMMPKPGLADEEIDILIEFFKTL